MITALLLVLSVPVTIWICANLHEIHLDMQRIDDRLDSSRKRNVPSRDRGSAIASDCRLEDHNIAAPFSISSPPTAQI